MFGRTHSASIPSDELKNQTKSAPEPQNTQGRKDKISIRGKYVGFGILITPTVTSVVLIISSLKGWGFSGPPYVTINENRATFQIAVQVAANALALLQALVICRLINHATRIWFYHATASLDTIGLWTALSTRTMDWRLPPRMALPLLAFVGISPVLSALWAGSLTPEETVGFRTGSVDIPSWSNISLVKEYPSEIDQTGPTVFNSKGRFTYSVGVGQLASLISSAATATTVDRSVRTHSKFDNSGFSYYDRSYGVGAAVGISDDSILASNLVTNYSFEEAGYDASVNCIYNRSSLFSLREAGNELLHAASGPLPDSDGIREYSVYFGRDDQAIVAVGVSYVEQVSDHRYLAIAAGSYYEALNSTQCTITFTPTLFNVSVNIGDNEIRVQKISDAPDIDPTRQVMHVALRQMELFSNDLTSLYRSTLGDAFNASISNYITSAAQLPEHPTQENITLAGLTNSITSLTDDILGSYAAAQLVVGNSSTATPIRIQVISLRIGNGTYIIAILVVNLIVIVLVIAEAIRTRGWRKPLSFDYTDVRHLIVASSLGGAASRDGLAEVENKEQRGKTRAEHGATDFPDKVRQFQLILGGSQGDLRRNGVPNYHFS